MDDNTDEETKRSAREIVDAPPLPAEAVEHLRTMLPPAPEERDATDAFLQRLAAAAPDLSERQTAMVRQLLGTTPPSPTALARVRQILHQHTQHEDTPKTPR